MTDPARSWPNEAETPLFFAVIQPKEKVTVPQQNDVEQASEPRVDIWEGRHPGTVHFKEMFAYNHLATDRLAEVSSRCADLAFAMVADLPDGPELTAGLRALWEAKNCFVIQAARFSGVDHGKNKAGA